MWHHIPLEFLTTVIKILSFPIVAFPEFSSLHFGLQFYYSFSLPVFIICSLNFVVDFIMLLIKITYFVINSNKDSFSLQKVLLEHSINVTMHI